MDTDKPETTMGPQVAWRTLLLAALAVVLVMELSARVVVSQSAFSQDLLPLLLNEHREHAEERDDAGISTEVLFFGSSTSGADFDPNLVGEHAYDLWWAGAGAETMAAFAEGFGLGLFGEADTVVVGVTSRELNDSRAQENATVLADATRSLAWRRVAEDNFWTRVELALSDRSALVRYRENLRRPTSWLAWALVDLEDARLTTDETGRLVHYRDRSGAEMSEADLERERQALGDYEVGGAQAAGLTETLQTFGDRRVILVFLPVSDRYVDLHPGGQADIDAAIRVANESADEANAEFLDLSGLLSDPEYFGDANHMNQRGSTILTQRLIEELGL